VLDNTVVARVLVAVTHLVTLKHHGWIIEVKAFFEDAVLVVPASCGVVSTFAGILKKTS
jgi:hypothetical protein